MECACNAEVTCDYHRAVNDLNLTYFETPEQLIAFLRGWKGKWLHHMTEEEGRIFDETMEKAAKAVEESMVK